MIGAATHHSPSLLTIRTTVSISNMSAAHNQYKKLTTSRARAHRLRHSPASFSIQGMTPLTWIPSIPTVNRGNRAHLGPLTPGFPTHCTA